MQTVDLNDAHDVVVNERAVERAAGFRLQRFAQIVVLDLLVALEGKPRDGRIFHDGDQNAGAIAPDLHILE